MDEFLSSLVCVNAENTTLSMTLVKLMASHAQTNDHIPMKRQNNLFCFNLKKKNSFSIEFE